ncbi:hypothetical protein AOV_02445 [Anaplasma ovis str. Haibei]|uniref:Uncharacterized protein n=1 Tax=Anaplasma ovis str. Haibei TaxID=1248439 RepID=A0A2Z2L867_9RICK|nr:hypothetical protein AOV_02445 [Anaplasma ovis str. Haibei]
MYRGKPLKSDVIEPPKSRSPQGNNGVHAHNMARRCFSNDDIGGASRNRAQSPRGTAARSASVNSAKRSVASTNGISANSAGSTGIRGMRLCEIRSARMEAKIAKPVVRSGKPSKVSTPTPGQASKQNGQLLRVSSAKPAEQGGERAPDVLGSPEPTQANGKVSTPAPEQASKQNGQLSRVPASPAEQGGERALDVLGSLEPTQANGKVSTPAPEQASKQNGQLSRVPDAESGEQNAALDTSARNVQSGSGGDSNPPPEGSASPEARVTLDGSYCNKLLETEPFGNPYKLAAVLADNIQECSRVDVSPSTVYSLFCNPLLSELIGDSYIPGVLRPKVTRTVCKFARSVDFQRGRVVVDEVRSVRLITVNRYAAGAISVGSYTYGIDVASRMQLNAQVFQDLLSTRYTPVSPESIASKNVANTVLRFIFSYLVHLESLRRSTPQEEEEADATVLSILEYLDDEHTNIHNILHTEDYQGFYQYMKHLVARDAGRANSLLLSAGHKAAGYMAEHYNALLSNIIAYQCVKAGCPSGPETRDMLEKIGRNTLQHLMPLLCFSTALTSVAAQLYNATNKEDLVHAMSADSARFIMESHSFRSTLVGDVAATLRKVMPPLEVHTRYNQENLEKIAAAIFIFYPGCNFDGSDIVLGRDGLKLLNVGEGKIRTSHDFFNEEEVSRIVQRPDILLSELQMLFWGFRLSAGPLKWKEFLLELNELCETMITSQFAEAAQSRILRELTGINHLRQLDDRIGQVVYESFLPRVLCIRDFLRNAQLTESAANLIGFLPGPSATSGELSRLLLRICGLPDYNSNLSYTTLSSLSNLYNTTSLTPYFIGDQESGTPQSLRGCEQPLKAAIDEYAGRTLSRFQFDDRESVVERNLEDEFSRDPTLHYRPKQLSERQRCAIVKTASRRSIAQRIKRVMEANMFIMAFCFASICSGVFLVRYTPPYVFIPYVALVGGLLGFWVGWFSLHKSAGVEHCLSNLPMGVTKLTLAIPQPEQPPTTQDVAPEVSQPQSLSSLATVSAISTLQQSRNVVISPMGT